MTELQELLNDTTNQTYNDTPQLDPMDCETFKLLIIENERIELIRKRIVIDSHIVIESVIQLIGTQSILKFDGGSIQFIGDIEQAFTDQQNIIRGFSIEGYNNKPCFKVHSSGLLIMDCTVENFSVSNSGLFIDFDGQLHINDTTIKGYAKIARSTNQQINLILSVQNSTMVNQQEQSIFFEISFVKGGKIDFEKCKFKGNAIGLSIQNCQEMEIVVADSKFSKQQTAILMKQLDDNYIYLARNVFKKSHNYAIRMDSIRSHKLQIENNHILKCCIGLLLQDVMENTQLVNALNPILFKQNTLKGMEQTAMILREVVCIQIEESIISENSIGLDVNISTDRFAESKEINPLIITVNNCRFSYNRIHGMFINGNLELHPIYLQISQSTFQFNGNVLNLSHQGASVSRFKVNVHGCSFEENNNSSYFNQYYDVITTKTNIIKKKQQPNQNAAKMCSIM